MKETPSQIILFIVALLAWGLAFLQMCGAFSGSSPLAEILAGISATCGTVALAGTGIIAQLRKLQTKP